MITGRQRPLMTITGKKSSGTTSDCSKPSNWKLPQIKSKPLSRIRTERRNTKMKYVLRSESTQTNSFPVYRSWQKCSPNKQKTKTTQIRPSESNEKSTSIFQMIRGSSLGKHRREWFFRPAIQNRFMTNLNVAHPRKSVPLPGVGAVPALILSYPFQKSR